MPKRAEKRLTVRDRLEGTPGLLESLLERITTEEKKSPSRLSFELGLSWGGVLSWASEDEERMQKLRNALEVRAHLLAESALKIADGARNVPKAKLQVDTRKWLATNLNPKWYGEKKEVQHTGSVGLIQLLSSLPSAKPEKLIEIESGGEAPPILVPESQAGN